MSNFMLMTNTQQFANEADKVWRDYSPTERDAPIMIPRKLPCLAVIFISSNRVRSIITDKRSAKRIVYPKTNKHRLSRYECQFSWIEGNLEKEVERYVNNTMNRKQGIDRKNPLQVKRINEIISDASKARSPMLITSRVSDINSVLIVNFFFIDKNLASTLVYYNKDNGPVKIKAANNGLRSSAFAVDHVTFTIDDSNVILNSW